MHIPDGFLSLPVVISTTAVSAALLYPAIKKVDREAPPERVPLMGLAAAFVFTAQLLSFPVFGGTSVHLTGAVLISILLGPLSGFLITASAVLLQAFLFQHGGLITAGANVLNLAVIQSILGYCFFRMFPAKWFSAGAFLAAFITVTAAAAVCAVELIVSGTIPLKAGLIAMVTAHLFAGAAEGVITVLILGMIRKVKPELLELNKI